MSESTTTWIRSSYCSDGTCVEVAAVGDMILVRDGKDTTKPPIRFTRSAWQAFLDGVTAEDRPPE